MINPHEPGSKVVIRHNPHRVSAVDVVGTVVGIRPGAGFYLSTQAQHLGTVHPFALSNAQDLVLGYR